MPSAFLRNVAETTLVRLPFVVCQWAFMGIRHTPRRRESGGRTWLNGGRDISQKVKAQKDPFI